MTAVVVIVVVIAVAVVVVVVIAVAIVVAIVVMVAIDSWALGHGAVRVRVYEAARQRTAARTGSLPSRRVTTKNFCESPFERRREGHSATGRRPPEQNPYCP